MASRAAAGGASGVRVGTFSQANHATRGARHTTRYGRPRRVRDYLTALRDQRLRRGLALPAESENASRRSRRPAYYAVLTTALGVIAALSVGVGLARAAFPERNGAILFLRGHPARLYAVHASGRDFGELRASSALPSDLVRSELAVSPPLGSGHLHIDFAFTGSSPGQVSVYTGTLDAPRSQQAVEQASSPGFTLDGGLLFTPGSPSAGIDELSAGPSPQVPLQLTHPPTGSTDNQPSWSIDSRLAFVRTSMNSCGSESNILVASDGGRTAPVPFTHNGASADPDWFPDGSEIAYDSTAPLSSNPCRRKSLSRRFIIVADASGLHARRLTRGSHPSWSPDGRYLTFQRGRSVCVIRSNGSGLRVLAHGSDPVWTSWTPYNLFGIMGGRRCFTVWRGRHRRRVCVTY